VIHVLYVDDEPALLELTKLYLERSGDFTVDTTVSAQQAAGRLQDSSYDLVISDYEMPETNGIEFLQQLRKTENKIPFIIFTGRGREEVVIDAINAGADAYIQKGGNPVAQFAELAEKIRQIIRRTTAERALEDAEARYRAMFQNMSDILRILDKNGRIAYDSPSSSRILGYPPGSLVGKDPMDYVHPDDIERIRSELSKVFLKKNPGIPSEFRIRKADGNYIWVESVADNLIGVNGVDGIVVTTRPIAERKKAEEEIRKKHEDLHAAFEQLTATEEELRQNYDELAKSERRLMESERRALASEAFLKCVITDVREGITALDTGLRYTLWNPFMEELTGIPASQVLGKHLFELFPHFADAEIRRGVESALEGKIIETPDMPLDLQRKKKRIWVRFIGAPLYTPDGTVSGIIGVVQDITSRKEAELALLATTGQLRESEEKYRNVFEAKNNPLLLVDEKTQEILELNQAASDLYGYPLADMTKIRLMDLSAEPEKTRETLIRQIPRVSLRYHRKKDGTTFPADITLAYFTLKGRSVLILSIRDLTGVQQIGEALRIANVKLNLMIGITRHDVLNSLTSLLGYNEILKSREIDAPVREMLEKQGKALNSIRNQIEFTRTYDDLGVKAPVWQHVGNTASRAYAQFINSISFVCETGDLEIYADPMLEKVFYNLFDNAFRYGETVTKVRLYGEIDGSDLLLFFEDNGAGIPDNEKMHVFSRGIGKNTGLGLFLTREILAITRITIQENGEYRKGARFMLRVPRGMYRLLK